MPKGSAKFEEVLDGTYLGVIREAAGIRDDYKSGIVEYIDEDGVKKNLVFSPHDVVVCSMPLVVLKQFCSVDNGPEDYTQ